MEDSKTGWLTRSKQYDNSQVGEQISWGQSLFPTAIHGISKNIFSHWSGKDKSQGDKQNLFVILFKDSSPKQWG